MTQAKPRFASFEEYLASEGELEGRYELIDGELVELPPESEPNNFIARYLLFTIASSGNIPLRLIIAHSCEVQVPVLQQGDAANRYPDLVILDEVHPDLMRTRLTIKIDMPPPRLVAEVLSPGKANRERDLIRKRVQYAKRGVPEYWLIDPEIQTVTVLRLESEEYFEIGVFQGNALIQSPTLRKLNLTAGQIFAAALEQF